MRIVIFGAGSLGSALGALLSRNNDVVLIGRRHNMAAVRAEGLKAIGDVDIVAKVRAHESVRGVDPPELLLITTKAYDTPSAIEACREWVAEDTMVLTLQNGLGNLEALRSWKGRRAFGGTTTMGANLVEPGIVKLSGFGKTIVGSDLDPAGARRIARSFCESGLPTVVKRGTLGEIWAKAIISACINPMTAVLRVPNGTLLRNAAISRLVTEVCAECEAVARAMGIKLPYRSMISRVRGVATDTANNRSSMLQDVERGGRTEIAQVSGAFVRHGLSENVPTPLNLTLLTMVEALRGSVDQYSSRRMRV
jgi:2-dehydropantoate 2-reductase